MQSNKRVIAKLKVRIHKALACATLHAKELPTFDHFSYQADWSNFPNSLMIECHLQPNSQSLENSLLPTLSRILQPCLLKQGFKFRDFRTNLTLNVLTD